jgi:hypothetical protein
VNNYHLLENTLCEEVNWCHTNYPQEKLHVSQFLFNAVNAAIIFNGANSIMTTSPNISFKLSQIKSYLFVYGLFNDGVTSLK